MAGQRSSGTGEGSVERPTKPHPPCPLGADVENVGTEKVSKARLCALGFQDSRIYHTSPLHLRL